MAINYSIGNILRAKQSYISLTLKSTTSRTVRSSLENLGGLVHEPVVVLNVGNTAAGKSFIHVVPQNQKSKVYRGGRGIIAYFDNDTQLNDAFELSTAFYCDNICKKVRNTTGVTIPKGSAVRLLGYDSTTQLPLVDLADATTPTNSKVFGITEEAIEDSTDGSVVVDGAVIANTTGFSTVGDDVYLSNTPGAVSPTAGTNAVVIGNIHVIGMTNGAFSVKGTSVGGSGGGGGSMGATGIQGPTGIQGNTGSGTQGSTGLAGPGGGMGATGVQGMQGDTGVQGITGFIGSTGTQGLTGVFGTTGLVQQGATGIQGLLGGTGIQGSTGISGGGTGLIGATGFRGDTGIQGNTGISGGGTGLTGTTGLFGDTGIQGNTGLSLPGVTGLVGPAGMMGDTGVQGLQGSTGIQGATGFIGTTGIQGLQGLTGLSGGTGLLQQGQTGVQGLQGGTGLQGFTGLSGGGTGLTGATGLTGNTGILGIQGVTGLGVGTALEVLATIDNVDATVGASTVPLYSVPGGLNAVVNSVVFRMTGSDTITTDLTGAVGWSPSTNNVMAPQTLTNITAVNDLWTFAAQAKSIVGTAGATLVAGLTGMVGNTGFFSIDVVGYEF